MRQAILVAPGRIEFRDVPIPQPGETDVLIEVKRIGVCGSDVHVFHGKHPYTRYPVVQGHEFSGRVAAVGSKIRNIEPGQKVTATPQIVCGKCAPCTSGKYHICDSLKVMGFQAPGCAQDFFPISAEKLVPLPDNFSYEDGALLEPLAVAVHAVQRAGQSLEGTNVVIMGAGPIGNLVAQVARAGGARRVVITDVIDHRLELATRCGIASALNFARPDFLPALSKAFGGEKIDLFIECVGSAKTLDCAVQNVKKGGTIVVVGVYSAKVPADMGLVQDREIDIHGSLMYQIEDYRAGIELIQAGKIETGRFVTNTFSFADYPKAYEFIEQAGGRNLKVMIVL